jgi:transposase-like protein
MMYVRFPLSLRNVEDLLFERGIDICHETVRHWWNRFGPLFASGVRRQRVSRMRGFRQWQGYLDEVNSRWAARCTTFGEQSTRKAFRRPASCESDALARREHRCACTR